jgi:hypothetical protein
LDICTQCGKSWNIHTIVIKKGIVTCPHCGLYPMEWTHCWNLTCRGLEFPRNTVEDKPYGHCCPKCKKSLRTHPFFGKGKQFDLGVGRKIGRWIHKTSAADKAKMYRSYGFPVTVELLKEIDKERKSIKVPKQLCFEFQFGS